GATSDVQPKREGGRNRRGERDAGRRPPALRERYAQRRGTVPRRREGPLQPLDGGIRLSCSLPEIVVAHVLTLISSRSRKSFIPRCRFTRTESGVRPTRAAISGPLMPSTRRNTRGSRYASGSRRIASSTSAASERRGPFAAESPARRGPPGGRRGG